MSRYAKQLIAEISEHLDSEIVDFFDETKETYQYIVDSVPDLVEYTLEETAEGKTTKEDLRKVYDSMMRNRRRKKARWMEKLENDVKTIPKTDLRFPFSRLVGQKSFLTKAQWKSFYGDKTLDDLINEQMLVAKEWLAQPNSYFVSFPGIHSHSVSRIFESLVSDTLLCMYQYISEQYDGSIENYFLPFPKNLIGFPLFAPKRVKLTTTLNDDNTVVENYDYGEGVLETSTRLQTVNDQLSSMDQNDLKILYTSLQNLDVDFYTTRQARVKKRTLVKQLHGRPSKKHYDMMEEHCHKLSKYNFSVTSNGKKKVSFNLIDSVDTSDPDEVVFTYGTLLYNSIIANEITNIKSANLQLLELNLSAILYQSLFRERIILSTKDTSEMAELAADYPYAFFSSNVRFPNQSKKKNMDLIEESLKEFMEKGIVVKSFERKASTQFRICFYPLSEDERADLKFNRYKNIQVLEESEDEEND